MQEVIEGGPARAAAATRPALRVDVVIPALDEERALPHVLAAIPRARVRRIVVCDNGSADRTAEVARAQGAEVVHEPRRGYGAACQRALAHLAADPPDVVVFVDGDASDRPEELPALLAPIEAGEADLVVGSRTAGVREPGALTPQQRVGNAIACAALGALYGAAYTDLGPFRAIRWGALARLGMQDLDYGWTVEMQIAAARAGLAHREVPVSYRRRIGASKVSGTLRGTIGASRKILWWLGRHVSPRDVLGRLGPTR
jgi:glycosyltransferase involved in cell wall biosynthesis